MRKINILYIITKLELGGAQNQLLSIISQLNRERFNIFLFTAKDGILVNDALSIHSLNIKMSRFLERPISPIKDLLALTEIYYFIKKYNIDIVHTHSSKAGILGRLAAKLAKVKIIIHTVHGWSFNDFQSTFKRMFFIWLERISAKFTNRIIVVSNYDKQKGLDRRIGESDKYRLIYYGIDYKRFNITDKNIRKELDIDDYTLTIGMVSCFKHQKSPQDFIKLASLIVKALPQTKFIIVGDGVLRKKIERAILKFRLQDKVVLAGWRRDIPRLLSAIDVFALTSLWEGLPISVLEAMAASLPVVATHTGGIADVIKDDKTGFLVSPRDMSKMAEKVITLLKNETMRKQIGKNARGSLDFNHSIENMIKNTQSLYEDLIKTKIYSNNIISNAT